MMERTETKRPAREIVSTLQCQWRVCDLPAAPTPAKARPKMRTLTLGATPQMRDPYASKSSQYSPSASKNRAYDFEDSNGCEEDELAVEYLVHRLISGGPG